MKVAQSCPTLCNPMDYTVHGILQPRILEWVAFPFSRGSSQPRDRTQVSRIAGGFFTSWATREAQSLLEFPCLWVTSSFLCALRLYHIVLQWLGQESVAASCVGAPQGQNLVSFIFVVPHWCHRPLLFPLSQGPAQQRHPINDCCLHKNHRI